MKLTPAARAELQRLLDSRGMPAEAGVLVSVRGGGCQGLTYVMDLLRTPPPSWEVEVVDEVRVLLDPQTAAYVRELTLDFVSDSINQGFVFRNPSARATCGCGSSFAPRV
jgi:iron-sulfur cluster assembly protein